MLLIAAVIGVTGVLTVEALGLRQVQVDADPFEQPTGRFDYAWWSEALKRWVRDGRVDYDAVRADEGDLHRFASTLATTGPRVTPDRFPSERARLAYYINAYNALVMLGVVDNWPIGSVQDVRGWLDPRAGFGFFYGLHFRLDGDDINLYTLENEVIRGFLDARIHAAINCASKSCPALGPGAFEPASLDRQLDEATIDFCSRAPHVQIDDEQKKILLSAIFDWYRTDFEEHARRLGRPPTVLDFILAFATADVAAALQRARDEGYQVEFIPYDWTLNGL